MSSTTPADGPVFDLTDPNDLDDVGGPLSDDDGPVGRSMTSTPDTPLASLEADLLADIDDGKPIRLEVDGRPGYVALYRRDLEGAELERWRRRAKRGKSVDLIHFGALVIAGTMVGLEKNGERVLDPDTDEPLTIRSPYMQTLYGTPTAAETARTFFGTDGYVNAQCEGILEASGWGAEAIEADPS